MERVKKFLKSDEPVTWLFYGDSITHGVYNTMGWRDYTQLFNERVRNELGRMMDVVINTAISGNTTENLLESFDWRVKRFSPDVVFLMIGMNDCSDELNVPLERFKSNLENLARRFEELGSLCVMQTTCLILPGTAVDRGRNFADYMEAVREVARDNGLPLIDHTKYWQKHVDKLYLLMSNEFHPNEFGHRFFAKLIFEELEIFSKESICCSLLIP